MVLDAASSERKPVFVRPVTEEDLTATRDWQTNWTTPFALGLMSYEFNQGSLAVEIIYLESARHSNANLLRVNDGRKRYIGIAKALFAYAAQVSMEEILTEFWSSGQKPLSYWITINGNWEHVRLGLMIHFDW